NFCELRLSAVKGILKKILARPPRIFSLVVQMNTHLCLSVFICGFIYTVELECRLPETLTEVAYAHPPRGCVLLRIAFSHSDDFARSGIAIPDRHPDRLPRRRDLR